MRLPGGESTVRSLSAGGGLLQMLAGLAILFLPLLQQCGAQLGPVRSGQPVQPPASIECSNLPYLGHGNSFGYLVLTIVVLTGLGAIVSSRLAAGLGRQIRWLAALISLLATMLTGFSFGPFLLPGTLLLLVGALAGEGAQPRRR